MAVTIGSSYDYATTATPTYTGNATGWTTITPSGTWNSGYSATTPVGTSNVIYVAAAPTGNDSNPGTPASPIATLSQAALLVRNGSPDWVLLRKGDTWTDAAANFTGAATKSGLGENDPMVIASYSPTGIDTAHPRGTAAGARPVLHFTSNFGQPFGNYGTLYSQDYIAIIGIEINSGNANFNMYWEGCWIHWVLIEDCKLYDSSTDLFSLQATNDTTQANIGAGLEYHVCHKAFVRRNIFFRTTANNQGVLCSAVSQKWVFEENIVHQACDPTVNTVHNWYFGGFSPDARFVPTNTGVLSYCNAGGNINTLDGVGASHFRSGGNILDNLFYNCQLGIDFGYAAQQPAPTYAHWNVMIGGGDQRSAGSNCAINTIATGAIYPPGTGDDYTTGNTGFVRHNVLMYSDHTHMPAGDFAITSGFTNYTADHNLSYSWSKSVDAIVQDYSGMTGNTSNTNYRFNADFSTWDFGPPTGFTAAHTMDDYMVAKFGSGTVTDFINNMLLRSYDNWDYRYTANSVNNYMRQGVGFAQITSAGVVVSPSTVPNGTVGTLYTTQSFSATGGTAPYTWSSSGTIPPGLTFHPVTATLDGTPTTTTGSPFTFIVSAQDSTANPPGSQSYTVSIAAATGPSVRFVYHKM
jgi:hypothetical protein